MTDTIPEDASEVVDARLGRIDLVKAPAHGQPFLIAKSAMPTPADVAKAITKEPTVTEAATETVVKADGDDEDPTVVLAEPEIDAPGDPDQPGSPAWEAIDAATACKWTAMLGRCKNALLTLADREGIEAITADPDDAENAFDLQDGACAIDYAISMLAPYAASEAAEIMTAEDNAAAMDAMAGIAKAAASIDTAQLDVLEGFGPVVKAGKVLSASNENAIRSAVDSLQNVLSTLPQAEEAAVTKTAVPPVDVEDVAKTAADTAPEPLLTRAQADPVAPEPVEKAKGDPQMAVFDASGNLVGTIDPTNLTPIAAPTPPAGGDAQGADAEPTPTDEAAAAAQQAPPTEGAGAATVPGTDTIQSPPDNDDDTVTKGAVSFADEIKTAFIAALKESGLEDVTKASAALEERLARVEARPAAGGPLLNGANGQGGIVDRDGSGVDQLTQLKKAAQDETDPAKRSAILVEVMKATQAAAPAIPAKQQTWGDVLTRFSS